MALPRPFGWSGMLDKILKIFWTTAYSMQKEVWKNVHPFSCVNFLNKNGRGPATPFVMPTEHRPCTWKIFSCISSYCNIELLQKEYEEFLGRRVVS